MDVEQHLDGLVPLLEQDVHWRTASFRMRVFLTDRPVPHHLFGSSRAVVLQGDRVLVLRNTDGAHVLPGGRREGHESPEQTVRREVLEETGWALHRLEPLAVVHLHFIGPPSPEHVGPHPDLLWPVFAAEAGDFVAEAVVPEDYELSAELVPVEEALALPLAPLDATLLRAALRSID